MSDEFGVRRHAAALDRGDMSPEMKARSGRHVAPK